MERGPGTTTERKLTFCYNMPFCKIEFFDHMAELYNKKIHSHPYHIHPELGHIS